MEIFTTLSPFGKELEAGSIRSGEQLQQRVREAGFDGIELHLRILEYPEGRKLLEGLDYRSVSLHSNHHEFSLGSANRYRRHAAVEQLSDELALAAEKGARMLTFHPGYEGKKISRRQAHDNMITALGTVFSRHSTLIDGMNTELAVENMDDTTTKLCRFEEEVERVLQAYPKLGLTCDLAHCAIGGHDVEGFVQRFESRIRHLHVSGFKPNTSHSAVSLPQSELDLRPVINRLAKRDLIFCIENKTLELTMESRDFLVALRDALPV